MKQYFTHSPDETKQRAAELASKVKAGDVLLLIGELGSGKTTFVQGLARALGLTNPIKSPTFTLVWEYDVPDRDMKLYHFDLYRLQPGDSTEAIGLDEALHRKDGIVVIEWAEKLVKQPEGIKIMFERNEDKSHTITIGE